MTPIELRRQSDRAIASLQAMRDAADIVDGLPVAPYEGVEPDEYRRILEVCLADLRAPVLPPLVGTGWGRRQDVA